MIGERKTAGASVDALPNGFRLTIPAGDDRHYRLAQLDNYAKLKRRHFPAHPPLTLSLRARASAASLPGTWGFGLWNDPFGLSLGFGGQPGQLPALPNAAWFFHASEENFLSLGERPGNGFLAQVFRSPVVPSLGLALAGMPALPFLFTKQTRAWLRALLGRIVQEEGVRLGVDVTEWHNYRLEWSARRCAFWVDEALALETSLSPHPPLGLVIWIDNQHAAWTPDGTLRWGLLKNEVARLEVAELAMT